jgi:hypothetical protein
VIGLMEIIRQITWVGMGWNDFRIVDGLVFGQIQRPDVADGDGIGRCVCRFILSDQTLCGCHASGVFFHHVRNRLVELVVKEKRSKRITHHIFEKQRSYKILGLMVFFILLSGLVFSKFTDAHIPFWDSNGDGDEHCCATFVDPEKI